MAAPAAYATEATKRHGAEPWAYVTIGGVGHRADADGRSPTKWSTYLPPSSYSTFADFRDRLAVFPSYSSDVIHRSDGSSDPGTCEFTIADIDEDVSEAFAYLSAGKPVTGTAGEYATQLNADLPRTATTMVVTDSAGLALNTMVFLDAEAVRITAIAGVNVTITRAQWNTHATRHYAGDPVRASANDIRGQLVEVYRNFAGLTSADEYLRWRGIVTGIAQTDDGMGWTIQAQSILALLDAEVMRKQGRFRVSASVAEGAELPLGLSIVPDSNDGFSDFPDTDTPIWIGCDGASGTLLADKSSASAAPSIIRLRENVDYVGLDLADTAKWIGNLADTTIFEVFPTGRDLAGTRFTGSDPFRIWLAWVLSRDGLAAVHGAYDILPEGCGLERIASAWVAVSDAEHLGDALGISLPHLVYGLKGSFSLKRHQEEELFGPYRVIVVTHDGVLTPILMAPKPEWLTSSAVTVTHDDIAADTLPVLAPDMADAVEHAVAATGYSYLDDKPHVRQEAHLRKRAKWTLSYGRTVEYELHGYRPGTARSIIKQILTAYVHIYGQPPPRMELDLPDTFEHQIKPGDTLTIKSDHMIDLSTGSRSASGSYQMTVVAVALDGETLRLGVTLEGAGDVERPASISPAIRIDAVVSSAGPTIVDAELDPVREFTTDGVFDDAGYNEDHDWFLGGGAGLGDAVSIVNGNDLTVRTSGHVITSIALNAGRYRFTITGGSASVAANDYITFDVHGAANTTTRQKLWAYIASGGRLGSSNEVPYIIVA